MSNTGLQLDDRDRYERSFSSWQLQVTACFVEVVLADEDISGELLGPPRDFCEKVANEFDVWAGSGSANVRFGIRTLLSLLDLFPVLFIGAFSRFCTLSLRQRLAYLEALEHSPIGLIATGIVGLKIPITMLAYEHAEQLRVTGFDRESTASRRPTSMKETRSRLPTLRGTRKTSTGRLVLWQRVEKSFTAETSLQASTKPATRLLSVRERGGLLWRRTSPTLVGVSSCSKRALIINPKNTGNFARVNQCAACGVKQAFSRHLGWGQHQSSALALGEM